MKIGFLIDNLKQGGAQRATSSLADSFVQNGHQAEIITFYETDIFYPLDKRVEVKNVGFDEIEHKTSFKRLFGAFSRISKLRSFVKEQNLDILIGMSFSMTYYAVIASTFSKTKAIGTERSNPYVYKATKLNTFLRKLFYRLSDGYVFQTKKAAGFFTKKLKKGIVIPNAIYNESVYSLSPPEDREKIIYSAGRLSEEKCYDLLIEAFSLISEKIPDYNLVIFGQGPEKELLEGKVKNLHLEDRVSLPGANPNAVEFINNGSVFVMTSRFEGMPNALMEAIAMGVPSISTNCEMGPDELIENEENGILVEVGNKEQIAQAILRIIEDDKLSEKFSQNGRKMLSTHSIDEISNRWIEYLESIKTP